VNIHLTEAEKRELLVHAKSGDIPARDRLVQAHLNLISCFAQRFARPGAFIEIDDLIQQGRLGLLRAIEKFDLNRESQGRQVSFVTYASYWIKHAMRRSIQKHGRTVAIPIDVQREMAAGTSKRMPPEMISMDHWLESDVSFSAMGRSRSSTESPEWHLSLSERSTDLHRWLEMLPSRERSILEHLYGFAEGSAPKTAVEVGARFGISEQRVGQLKTRAIVALKSLANAEVDFSPI